MQSPNCFFGLEVTGSKQYKQTPPDGVHLHVSQAALPPGFTGRVSLKATIGSKTFCLCTLVAGSVDQAALDLNFSASEEVTFLTEGDDIPVHLTGYYEVSDDVAPEDEGEEEEEEEEEEMDAERSQFIDDEAEEEEDEEVEAEEEEEEEEEEVERPPKKAKVAPQIVHAPKVPEGKKAAPEGKKVEPKVPIQQQPKETPSKKPDVKGVKVTEQAKPEVRAGEKKAEKKAPLPTTKTPPTASPKPAPTPAPTPAPPVHVDALPGGEVRKKKKKKKQSQNINA
eukprot:GGOE01018234.1.p1 GENE.GGOE01018234.1~~GGOE01018234.1.p1  ORF type:complete len:281 (+),score=89.21 GGOE01018234.1:81-923(+)